MLDPRFSCGATRRVFHPRVVLLWSMVGLLIVVLPTMSHAQQSDPPGGQMYFSRLGCLNCHGRDGRGAVGKPGGPYIANSPLPLRRFVGYVRLPSGMMPPFAPRWAPDVELAILYRWLGGIDAVTTPPPITVELKESPEVKAAGNAKAQIQLDITVLRAPIALQSDAPDMASLRYRLTLVTNGRAPVANQRFEYEREDTKGWLSFMTDEHGEALLGPGRRFDVASGRQTDNARTRLRIAAPTVRTTVVIEALAPQKSVVLGIGSVALAAQR
jgi:hypothetical protein